MENFLDKPEAITKLNRAGLAALFIKSQTLNAMVFARLVGGDVQPASAAAPAPSTAESRARMLNRSDVAKRIAVSKITVSRMVKRKSFPAPVRDGRLLRWREFDVAEWERRA